MDVKNIVRNLLIEQLDNKKLFNSMMLKWYGQNPTPQQLTDGEGVGTIDNFDPETDSDIQS